MSIATGNQHRVPRRESTRLTVSYTRLCHMGALAGAMAITSHCHVKGVQVAAWDWDGCLQAMPFSDCQTQQAEEQDSRCHGHLKRSGWEGKSLQLCLSPSKPGFWVFRL